jgi:integrase
VERDHVEANPVANIGKRAGNGARDRVLSDYELVAVWKASGEGSDYARIIRLLILTGQRREEIGGLRWTEIDFERRQIELPPARTKISCRTLCH